MSGRPPQVVALAGPNGAGKSTSAGLVLRGALAVDEFVNADTIARGLSAYRPDAVAFTAGRIMLDRLRQLASERRDFAFETTLSGRGHARWLHDLRVSGFRTYLVFLALRSADLAVARVRERVARGGHSVPDEVVRRRFVLGLRNLFDLYPQTVDAWYVYDNTELGEPPLVASGRLGEMPRVIDHVTWEHLRRARG